MKRSCMDCKYFEERSGDYSCVDGIVGEQISAEGICRRFPPNIDGQPIVFKEDWCYEYDVE